MKYFWDQDAVALLNNTKSGREHLVAPLCDKCQVLLDAALDGIDLEME